VLVLSIYQQRAIDELPVASSSCWLFLMIFGAFWLSLLFIDSSPLSRQHPRAGGDSRVLDTLPIKSQTVSRTRSLDTSLLEDHHGPMTALTVALFRLILTGRLLRTFIYILLLCGIVLPEPWPRLTHTPDAEAGARRDIRAGSAPDYPPFAIVKTDGTPDGFTVDLIKAVAEAMGLEVTLKVGPWDDLTTDLKRGRLDLLINMAYSKARGAFADFAVPHVVTNGGLFVRRGDTRIACRPATCRANRSWRFVVIACMSPRCSKAGGRR
jgi:Bacterial extracellular solute-binding proteins, family 3